MNWLDTIKTIAPTVASALGGPLAGIAVTALGSLFGISEPTQEKIKSAIEQGQMTGEQISAIRTLELQLQAEERERGFRYAELEFKNVADARAMKISTNSFFPELLSTLIVIGFFGILGWMMYKPSAIESQPLLIMLGSLGAAFGAVINYWLGSNKGSDRTKELLANSAPLPAGAKP
jgi:hypothetical protein